jgi:ATP:ADP antiporter, AAA family
LIPVMVVAVAFFYARTLTAFGPRRTLLVSTLGTAVLLVLSSVAIRFQINSVLWFLYLFKEAYIVLLIEQYWSFINSSIGSEDSRRINGIVCGIASIGSIAAGVVGGQIAETLGTTNLILIAGLVTIPAAIVADRAFAIYGEPQDKDRVQNTSEAMITKDAGIGAFRRERVLMVIMALVVIGQLVGTLLGLGFQGSLYDAMPDASKQSAYSYVFYAWVNGIAAVFQFFIAPLLLPYLGPRRVLIAVPCIHILAVSLCVWHADLTSWAIAFAAFKCIDYSIFRAAKEALYVPLSFAARYRAKELIDVVGYRFSKGITSGIITLIQTTGVVIAEGVFAVTSLMFIGVWLAVSFFLPREGKTTNLSSQG